MSNSKVSRILMRQGTESEWELYDSAKLAPGEIAVELDTNRMKFGPNDSQRSLYKEIDYVAGGITDIQRKDVPGGIMNALKMDSAGVLDLDIDILLGEVETNTDSIEALADSIDTILSILPDIAESISSNEDSIRHLDSLVASFLDSIDTNSDSIKTLDNRIDAVQNIVTGNILVLQRHSDSIKAIESQVKVNTDSIASIDTRLENTTTIAYRNLFDIHSHSDSIEALEESVESINDSLTIYMDSVERMDTQLHYHDGLLANLNGEVDDNRDSIQSILDKLVLIDDSITTLDDTKLSIDGLTSRTKTDDLVDGGTLNYDTGGAAGPRYVYRQSLPVYSIMESVDSYLGTNYPTANDTQIAIAGFNKFKELVMATNIRKPASIPVEDLEP